MNKEDFYCLVDDIIYDSDLFFSMNDVEEIECAMEVEKLPRNKRFLKGFIWSFSNEIVAVLSYINNWLNADNLRNITHKITAKSYIPHEGFWEKDVIIVYYDDLYDWLKENNFLPE